MEKPLISIILVCYNYEKYLPKAFNAIANQSFTDFEVVFVDNGCTDNSAEVANEFFKENPGISNKIIKVEKNQGAAYGENMGVQAASGKYLMFHDADDYMDSDTLEKLAKIVLKDNPDRVISAFRDVDDQGKVTQVQYLGEEPNYWLYGMQQANLFRRKIYVDNNIQTCSFWLDSEKSFLFNKYVNYVSYIFEPCYNYLVHTDSNFRNKDLYIRLKNDNHYSFSKLLNACLPTLEELKKSGKEVFPIYQLTRYYYSCIYQFLRDAPLKEKYIIYDRLNNLMKSTIPEYLQYTKQALKYKKVTRPYARRVALLSCWLERLHLMKLALLGYHLVSKVYYFKV